MLIRGKLIRKYWKVFMYLLLISILAFAISRRNNNHKERVLVKDVYIEPLKSVKIRQDEKLRNLTATVLKEKQGAKNKGFKLTSIRYSANLKVEQDDIPARNISVENVTEAENAINNGFRPVLVKSYNAITHVPEVRHIGFLKVHKAASSTMQNIFFRFGLKRNLTFVFTEQPNYFSRSVNNHIPLATPKLRQGYDILCNHGVFNYSIYSSILPKDTVYIGIVRDPLAVFISAVNFYSQRSQTLPYLARIRFNKLQKLIHRPEIFDKGFFSYTKNVIARDFGFPASNDINRISTKLNELGRIFRLVLIVEHFEESLVLMKRYLNWKMQDILFIPNNVYLDRDSRAVSVADLNSRDIGTFKIRNDLDYRVYEFFLNKFRKQFQSEPDDIRMEVLQFKKVLTNVSTFCHTNTLDGNNGLLIIEKSDWNEEFSVTAKDCWYMKVDELNFIKILRQKQGSEIKLSPQMRYRQGRYRFGPVHGRRPGYQQGRHFRGQRMMGNTDRIRAKVRVYGTQETKTEEQGIYRKSYRGPARIMAREVRHF